MKPGFCPEQNWKVRIEARLERSGAVLLLVTRILAATVEYSLWPISFRYSRQESETADSKASVPIQEQPLAGDWKPG